MLAGLFSLLVAFGNPEDWKKFEQMGCISTELSKKILTEAYDATWIPANKTQTKFLQAYFLLKNKEMPHGNEAAIVQLKDRDTIVFFIAGPASCTLSSLTKKETNFVLKLKD